MAARQIAVVTNDFADVFQYLQSTGIAPTPAGNELIQLCRQIHKCTYSMILWRFRLNKLPIHGRVFLDEIASDALQLLPQILMGYSKTSKLLIRGILENTLRHAYFHDHPIEFARMNREGKWFQTIQELLEYCKHHPAFVKSEKQLETLRSIGSLYSDLSAGIHGRAVRDLEMRVALKKILYDPAIAKIEAENVRKCCEAANFLLSIFHHKKMMSFQQEDRRIILRTLAPKLRQIIREHEAD